MFVTLCRYPAVLSGEYPFQPSVWSVDPGSAATFTNPKRLSAVQNVVTDCTVVGRRQGVIDGSLGWIEIT